MNMAIIVSSFSFSFLSALIPAQFSILPSAPNLISCFEFELKFEFEFESPSLAKAYSI